MPWTAFLFLAGVALFQHLSRLPQAWVPALLGAAILFFILRRGTRWWLWLPLGWVWAAGYTLVHEVPELPVDRIGGTFEARVVVAGLPARQLSMTRFVARIEPVGGEVGRASLVRLSWRDAPDLRVGQAWRAWLRLKPVHSYRNPGSWDYAGWLYRHGIRYSGYVVKTDPLPFAAGKCCLLERLRQTIRDSLQAITAPAAGKAILQALVLGDRSGITQSMRATLSVTGVSHLLAISGLHISLAAGLIGFAAAWFWRRTRLCRRTPAVVAGAVAGLAAATLYALLSGLGLPAQRALLMLGSGVLLLLLRRAWQPWQIFGQVLVLVLLFQPSAVLDAGFWLSFVAVAAILAMVPHTRGRPWWFVWLAMQTGISLALYPVLLAFDMPMAPLGLLINLVLVPMFSLLLIPAALLSAMVLLIPGAPALPAEWVARILAWIWDGLTWVAQPGLPGFRPAWSVWTLVGLFLGVVLLLVPPGVRTRAAGLVLILGSHLPVRPSLSAGEFRLNVLDVGQGLGTVIQTRNHAAVFDVGAAYPSGFNLADTVMLPWLRHQGLSHLDAVVLSHGDNDHAGAAPRLLEQVPARVAFSGEPARMKVPTTLCPSRYFWRWDGVVFGFIQPPIASHYRGNNSSCVLLVKGKGGSALLTGDAEAKIEHLLIPELQREAPVDVVVAGHHGSATSSSAPFVSASRARHVIYSAGYRNRYGFPKAEVDQRWAAAGATRWRTDGCGGLRVEFPADQPSPAPVLVAYTAGHLRYWDHTDVVCEMTSPSASSIIP